MSLINDMLRDLEARRADDLKRPNLQGEVRPLPVRETLAWRKTGLFAALLVAIVAAGAFWWQSKRLPDPPVTVAQPASGPAPAPVAQIQPAGNEEDRYELRSSTTLAQLPAETPVAARSAPEAAALHKPVQPSPKKVETAVVLSETSRITEPTPAVVATLPKEARPGVVSKAQAGAVNVEVKPVLATPRERADAEYRAAQALLAAGRVPEAAEGLRAALRQDAAHVAARQALVRVLLEQRKGDEAMQLLQEGLDQQPAQLNWAMSLARLQLERGDLGAAERTLARSAAHAGKNADYAGFHGHLHYRLGHAREAAAAYQTAIRFAPGEGRWWFGLAVALEGDGRAGEARDAYRQALNTGTLPGELAGLAEQKIR